MKRLCDKTSALRSVLFGGNEPANARSKRFEHEIKQLHSAIAKVQADRKELDKLAKLTHDSGFYPKLRRLEGADFNSPFNFAWQLDFPEIFSPERGGFDIVVGNPPFVTARNPKKNELYRERWKRVCAGKYLLICPFLDLSFGLLRPCGQLGFIVSNAFAKREFGVPLIEIFFTKVDLQKVIDCSGLLFPGHGTPTCLLFGAMQKPRSEVPIRIAAILPGGGDLRTAPEESPLWETLSKSHDKPGFANSQVTVADRSRAEMAIWPWNFDVGAATTQHLIEQQTNQVLRQLLRTDIGFDAITAANDIYFLPADCLRRLDLPVESCRQLLVGELLRNYVTDQTVATMWPYAGAEARPTLNNATKQFLQQFRSFLEVRSQFKQTQIEAGLQWFEYREYHRRALKPQLTYAKLASHLHVVCSDGNRVFNEHAPIIEPLSTAIGDHHLIAALLNSSCAMFWIKQVAFNKGSGEDEERDRFELLGGKVQQLPVPIQVADALGGIPARSVQLLRGFARDCLGRGQEQSQLALRKVLEIHGEAYFDWNASVLRYASRHSIVDESFESAVELKSLLFQITTHRERLTIEMIARQEEMDWLVYAAYGLIPEPQPALPEADLSLAREQRPFCLWGAADGDFDKAVKLIPKEWSKERKALWRTRLEIIRDNEHVRRIEQPVYKRRWDEQWKVGNRWVCGQPA